MSEKFKKSGRLQRGEPPTFRVMITHTKGTITISAWFIKVFCNNTDHKFIGFSS
jgi:hypothetical protein